MATNNIHIQCLAMTLLTILLLGGTRQVTGDDCRNVVGVGVLIACQDSILKNKPPVPPSDNCCTGVRGIGVLCSCKIITKEIEEIISPEKLVAVAKECGRPVPPGTQCGSYKVPPAYN